MANKPLGFPFGFFTNDNTPDSGKYFNRTATPPRPYLDVAEAMTVLPLGVRVAGLTINIAGIEYHWKPEWTTEALLNQAPVVRRIDTAVQDSLLLGGTIDVSDFSNGNITVDISKWLLTASSVQQVYETVATTLFTGIALSSAGNQRYVAFYGTNVNTIIKVEGTQSAAAVMPTKPVDTVSIGYTLVTDAAVTAPTTDVSGKANLNGGNTFTGSQIFNGSVEVRGSVQPGINFKVNTINRGGFAIFDDRLNIYGWNDAGNNSFRYVDFIRATQAARFYARPNVNGSDIALKSEVDANTTALGNKVDKVTGSSLVLNTEISRLASMTAIFTTALKNAYDAASSWVVTNGATVLSHLSRTDNPHAVTKSQVGLSVVDNTSDANKPVSTAAQTALNLKANLSGAAFTGQVSIPDFKSIYQTANDITGRFLATSNDVQISSTYGSTGSFKPLNFYTSDILRFQILANGTSIFNGDISGTSATFNNGVGIGIARVANAWLILAASTSAIASFLVTFGASYTGTVEGSVWGETTGKRLKIYRNGLADDFLFKNANANFAGLGNVGIVANNVGDLGTLPIVDRLASTVLTKTVNYTVTLTDVSVNGTLLIRADATAGNITITLPLAATSTGLTFIVKKTDVSANTVTLSVASTIDGTATRVLTSQYASRSIMSNGTNYDIIASI